MVAESGLHPQMYAKGYQRMDGGQEPTGAD
jgi:hypothetical protein